MIKRILKCHALIIAKNATFVSVRFIAENVSNKHSAKPNKESIKLPINL